MRFRVILVPKTINPVIPINYQYPLSAAIYKVLKQADADYAGFLHEKGYGVGEGLKHFKLFTFSDLKTNFKLRGDRMHISSDLELTVSFHLPEAAQHFVKGLFLSQDMDIADKKSKATFKVSTVEALSGPFARIKDKPDVSLVFKPVSPCVAGIKNEKTGYDFISPIDARFPLCIQYNWEQKLKAAGISYNDDSLKVAMHLYNTKPRSRLVTIKALTNQQTQIRGFLNFGLELSGSREQLELLYNAGAGLYNAQGMGCLEIDTIRNRNN